VTNIRYAAFWQCDGLTRLDLPDSVVAIEDHAIRECNSLVSVLVGSETQSVGQWAFAWNPALKGVYFAGDAPTAHAEAFRDSTPTVYRRAGTAGWATTLAGQPVELWTTYPDPLGWDAGYADIGGGWRRLGWFGDYVPMGSDGWIWHNKHGFFYVPANAVPESIWMFAQDMGWLWTGDGTYPFLYRASDGAWLWYNGSTGPRWFRNMTAGTWESRP
jgi:hypothetical protein